MKQVLFFLLIAVTAQLVNAQNVGIGTTTPNASAQLDVTSTTKGLLIPRMTGAQRVAIPVTIASVGLMVIQTNTESSPPSSPGIYLFERVGVSLVWRRIARTDEITSGTSTWTVSGIDQYSNVVGNVGIGTSANINEKLTVKGDALFVYPGSNNVTMSLMANTNNQARINFIKPDSSVIASIYSWDLVDRLYLQQGTNTNQLVLNDNGFVGIRTPTPTKPLDVFGSVRSRDTITADDDLVAGDDVRAGDGVIAGGIVSGSSLQTPGNLVVNGIGFINGNITTNTNLSVGGTSLLTGNVTTQSDLIINNATGTLQLKNSNVDKGFVQLSGDDLRLGTYSSNTTGRFVIRTGGNDVMNVRSNGLVSVGVNANGFTALNPNAVFQVTNSNDKFQIDDAGKVGIGYSSSEAILSKLHVRGGVDASLSTHGYLMLGPVSGANMVFDVNEIQARDNGGTNTLILQNDGGAVRIGNIATPSGYKFAINGKMICEEVRVALSANWPDYVFSDNYKLPSLHEIEKFIADNNHLPNIPSAKEVEKSGIELGEMNRKLLEKIEELTLYIIEQNKRITTLENLLPASSKK